MENKEIFREQVGYKIAEVKMDDKQTDLYVLLVGENGAEIKLSYHHNQDCCENVYADFSTVKGHIAEIIAKYILNEIIIKSVDNMGFILCLDKIKIFIPCYNEQNGYYSSDLDLIIESNGVKKTIDISEFVEDDIN